MTPGSGTRGSLFSSLRTFCITCVLAIFWLLLLLRCGLLDRVSAELAAQRGYDLHGEGVVLAGGEAGEEGAGDGVGGHGLVYGFEDGPPSLARVIYVAPDAVQVGVLL